MTLSAEMKGLNPIALRMFHSSECSRVNRWVVLVLGGLMVIAGYFLDTFLED